MERHDTQPYGNYLDKLGNRLQLLVSDLRAEKSSRANTDKRVLATEHRIQGMFAQLNRMDQDTIANNQFLAQRLAGMEQTFDSRLAKEVSGLADHTSGAWTSFDKQNTENIARLTLSMDDIEEDVQALSSQLDVLTSHVKDVEVDPKAKDKGPEEDLINNIIIRLARLEDNQSKLARSSNTSDTHKGKASTTQRSPRDSPEYDMFEDARSNEGHFSHLQSDEVAEISMGPTATRGEDPTISITSNNHCPLRDPYTNPGFSQNKIRSIQGHPTEGSGVVSLHMTHPNEDWLQEQVNQELLDQGAMIPITNINIGDVNKLNEWPNVHVDGHVTKRMPNGERGEEPLAGNTDCQDQDTTPTLAPLKANLPTEVSALVNTLQDTDSSSTNHQEEDQSSVRRTTGLTLHNIALGMFYGMTLMMLLHMLIPTTMYQGVNLAVRALDETNLFSFAKCGPRIRENYENVTRLARALLDFTARRLHRP